MMDLFERKMIRPMMVGRSKEAFDSPDYLFELKLDGERCIAYLDPDGGTQLRNTRNCNLLSRVPELAGIHRQVQSRCILDGEVVIFVDGKPDFFEMQRRSVITNSFHIQLQSSKYPASFFAFDILYYEDHEVTALPLMERKKLLRRVVLENDRLAVSRYLIERGIDYYQLVQKRGLDGIVAKQKDSRYYVNQKTEEWIKIRNLQHDDFVICGYMRKERNITSMILGQYQGEELCYRGHVSLGVSADDLRIMEQAEHWRDSPFRKTPEHHEGAVWMKPTLVCKVAYMMKNAAGSMKQPVFQGIRRDKEPHECVFGKKKAELL